MCAREGGVNVRAVARVPGAEIVGELHLCRPPDASGWGPILGVVCWGLTEGLFSYIPDDVTFTLDVAVSGLQLPEGTGLDVVSDDDTAKLAAAAEHWRWKVRRPRAKKGGR